MSFQIIKKFILKCEICGTDIPNRSPNTRYCEICKVGVDRFNARIAARKVAERKKRIWDSLSYDRQLELMDKVTKKFLDKK